MTIRRSWIMALTFLLLASATLHAATITYTGASGGDWATGSNWSSGSYPATGDYALLDTAANLSSTTPNNIQGIRIGTGGTGVLNMAAGAGLIATSSSGADSHVGAGAGNNGTVNQSGGTSDINYLEIGRGGAGLYTLAGGSFVIARERGGNSLSLGTDDTATVANGDGTFEISSGSFKTRAGIQLGSADGSGVGTFRVMGSDAIQIGIGSQSTLDGSWTQHSNSVLSVRVDATISGISGIFIDEIGNDGGGDVTFEDGALLDVGFTGAFTNGGTYTVMEWEGTLTDNGLQFAPGVDTNIWSFNLDVGNKKLEITAAGAPLILPEFVHPGITHKLSDLERMKYMVEAQIDPWYSSYQEMAADSKSSYNYVVQGDPGFTLLERDAPRTNYGAWNSDIRAAYYNAIRWYVTGDTRHADKAVEIFNAWTNLTSVTSGGTDALSGGVGYIMIEAAELIKSTYNGWSDTDIQHFKDMLVYPSYSTTSEPSGDTTFYWMAYQGDPGRHGNQGLSGWRTVMAMGIFLDNRIMYDRALRHLKGLPHRPDDLAYPSGPRTRNYLNSSNAYYDDYNTSSGTAVEDYGFNGVMTHYIWENGQCQESSRDQQHTFFGIGLICSMAEMAWNQGEDIYSHENDRLLLGLEYNMRYNVSFIQSYPDQTSPWEPTVASGEFIQRDDRTLRWYSKAINPDGRGGFPDTRPVFEIPVAHYIGRGFKTEEEAKWTLRARDKAIAESGYEVQGWSNDAIGWGGLSARRPAFCYGDPISGFYFNGIPRFGMHVVPGTIEAELYDHFAIHGEGHTYHDTTPINSGGAYRTNDAVDVTSCSEGGYALTDLKSGEWVTYTVAVPVPGLYEISIRYASSVSGGKIKFNVAGTDITAEVEIPHGSPASSGLTDWQDLIVATDVFLNEGVQSLRFYVSGTSGAYELNKLTLAQVGSEKFIIGSGDVTASTFQSPNAPTNTIDGDLGTRWSAQGDPQWIRYDLGAEMTVHSLKIAWHSGASRQASFHIETSNDDATWSALTPTLQSSGTTTALETVGVTPTLARYVRLVGHGNSISTWNSITEVEIWGAIPSPPPVPADLTPTSGDSQIALSWTGSAGATLHHLKRSTISSNGYTTIASEAGDSFLDTNVTNGSRYYYVVSAESAAGESTDSAEVSAVPSVPLHEGDVVIGETGIVPDGSGGQDFQLSITASEPGHNYQVWTSSSLVVPDWQIASGVVPGNGGELVFDLPVGGTQTNLFYKLEGWRQ